MAINWNQAEFVAPKLQIVPEQLPVEAGVKVGTVLQDRFDKSYENLTKAEEALRQMQNQASSVDKEIAGQIYNQYSEQLKNIDKSDLHNARWKTLKLAQEAANNYMSLAERNKQIQAQEEMISKDPRYALKREAALEDFRKNLSPISWDTQTKSFSNLAVSPYAAAADVDKIKFYATYGKLAEPIVNSIKNRQTIPVDELGNEVPLSQAPYFKTVNTQGQVSILSKNDLFKRLKEIGLADDNVRAELERDARRTGKTIDQLFQEEHIPAILATSDLLKQSKIQTVDQEQLVANKGYEAPGLQQFPGLGFGPSGSITNMMPSQNLVKIDKDNVKKVEDLEALQFNPDGSLNPSFAKNIEIGIKRNMNLQTSPSDFVKDMVSPAFYEKTKNKGFTDKEIINAYKENTKLKSKIVNSDWSFTIDKDNDQAMAAILNATQGAPFKDELNQDVKNPDLKGGAVKFNPVDGKFFIVKDDKTYYPTIELPTINEKLKKSAELVYEFADLNSDVNLIENLQGNDGNTYSVVIKKDNIRPDGSYTGTVSQVMYLGQDDAGKPKYQKVISESFDTKKLGNRLTPQAIDRVVANVLKQSVNQTGIK